MAGRIEFLDDASPAPAQPHRSPPRRRRPRPVTVLVLIGVVLAGLLVGRALTSSNGDTPAPQPSPTARPGIALAQCRTTDGSPTSRQTVDAPNGTPVTIQVPAAADRTVDCSAAAARCPAATDGQNACSSTSEVPRAVLLAVWSVFPSASLASARSETIRENGRLWFRYVRFRVAIPAPAELSVEVTVGHPDDRSAGAWDDGKSNFARAGVEHGQRHVVVSVAGPSGSASVLDKQYQLARDPALLSG